MALVRRPQHPALAGKVRSCYGFAEDTGAPLRRREGPGSSVVVVLSFGNEWRIGDATGPERPFARHTSFVAGLRRSSVLTEHSGWSAGVQVNLVPAAVHGLLRVPMHELAERTVPLDAVLGADGDRLVERLAEAPSWDARFALLEAALIARFANAAPSDGVQAAWRRLVETRGRVRIETLCSELGWSRRRLAARFREEVGLPPKAVARLLRFEHALDLVVEEGDVSWADIALRCGYYDQSHLINEFRDITGATPTDYEPPAAT